MKALCSQGFLKNTGFKIIYEIMSGKSNAIYILVQWYMCSMLYYLLYFNSTKDYVQNKNLSHPIPQVVLSKDNQW